MYRTKVNKKEDFSLDLNTELVYEENNLKEVKIISKSGETFVIKQSGAYTTNLDLFKETKYKQVEKFKVSALLPEGFELVKYFDDKYEAEDFKRTTENKYSDSNVILEQVIINVE